MAKEFKIFKNYGVLGAEKRAIYTYGAAHPLSDSADVIKVQLPDNDFFKLEENSNGDLFVESSWGWNYEINDLLQFNANDRPCFFALDKNMSKRRVYLETEETETEETEEKKMTKKVLRNFARTLKKGNIGNTYTLYTDGTILESVNGQDYIPGLTEYVSVEAQEGWTIKDYLQYIDLIIQNEKMIETEEWEE